MTSAQLIEVLNLVPHPEGGWFRETFRSSQSVVRQSDEAVRSGITCIDFLLPAGSVSRWHRVQSDEVWHFTDGNPLELAVLSPDGSEHAVQLLGRPTNGQPHAVTVPAGWWQAARPSGEWSLCTCTVGPGFDFDDFSFATDHCPLPGPVPDGWSGLI